MFSDFWAPNPIFSTMGTVLQYRIHATYLTLFAFLGTHSPLAVQCGRYMCMPPNVRSPLLCSSLKCQNFPCSIRVITENHEEVSRGRDEDHEALSGGEHEDHEKVGLCKIYEY